MRISKTGIEEIKTFRTSYFKSLPEFQELFLEIMMETSHVYLLELDYCPVGYAILNHEGVLIEFYVHDQFLPFCAEVFDRVLKELAIKEVYCKSFDALLLTNCMLKKMTYSVYGVMFRDYIEPGIQKDPEITMNKSNLNSVQLFKAQDDSIKELFETDKQLYDFIQNEDVFEFYKKQPTRWMWNDHPNKC